MIEDKPSFVTIKNRVTLTMLQEIPTLKKLEEREAISRAKMNEATLELSEVKFLRNKFYPVAVPVIKQNTLSVKDFTAEIIVTIPVTVFSIMLYALVHPTKNDVRVLIPAVLVAMSSVVSVVVKLIRRKTDRR